jgi:hypothetical protein
MGEMKNAYVLLEKPEEKRPRRLLLLLLPLVLFVPTGT